MKELVYTDEKYVAETTKAIQKALTAQQKLLDTWNALNIGECTDLFRLIHDPYNVYREAVKSDAPAVAGKYKIGEAFMEITDIPIPNELYTSAREAKRCIQVGRRELWSINDGKTVVLNQDQVDVLIHSRDIYVENEAQKEFVRHVIQYMESGNYLNILMQNLLDMRTGFSIPYQIIGRSFGLINALALEPEAVREMLKKL